MTTHKAHFWTTMTGLILAIAPLSVGMLALWLVPGRITWQTGLFVISPPAALGVAAFSPNDWQDIVNGRTANVGPMMWGMAVCAIGHAVLAAFFWLQAQRWFPRMIGR